MTLLWVCTPPITPPFVALLRTNYVLTRLVLSHAEFGIFFGHLVCSFTTRASAAGVIASSVSMCAWM